MIRLQFALLLVLNLACGEKSNKVGAGMSAPKPPEPPAVKEAEKRSSSVKIIEANPSVEGVDSYRSVGAAGFVVKNYLQLKAAADACLGPGLGYIRDDMFAPGRCQGPAKPLPPEALAANAGDAIIDALNGAGSTVTATATSTTLDNARDIILGADKCDMRSSHILEVLKGQLWDPMLAGRTDTLANQLTPAYLQALAVAADVYVHSIDYPQLLCDSEDKAAALVSRCLAQDRTAVMQVATAISGVCQSGALKARQALASILGSSAFAAATPKGATKEQP